MHSINNGVGNKSLCSFLIKGSSAFLALGLEALLGKTHMGLVAFWLCCLHKITLSDLSGYKTNTFMVKSFCSSHMLTLFSDK